MLKRPRFSEESSLGPKIESDLMRFPSKGRPTVWERRKRFGVGDAVALELEAEL